MGKFIDLTGKKFGHLTVLFRAKNKGTATMWHCKCDCGNEVDVSGGHLKDGHTASCGCLKDYKGVNNPNYKHGMSHKRLHTIWGNMKQRCYNPSNPKYPSYGARGIRLCDDWFNNSGAFINWALDNGYNDTLSIDRIDVNGNYEPSNCRWVTNKEQAVNKTNNHFLTYKGERKTISEWAKELRMSFGKLEARINRYGWSTEEALSTP